MKNILILLSALLFTTLGMAQSVPEGMRFQAVARDLQGNLLADQQLQIQVELFAPRSTEKVFYSEMHQVRSSELGLLDFVIGEGDRISGRLGKIPWHKEEMWVRIAVKTPSDRDYQIISSGQLYSVPYALYAESAGALEGTNARTGEPGLNSINWTLEGNYNSQQWNNSNPVLGTTDANDLVIVTNNVPRCIIDKDGMVNFLVDVDIDGNLNVDGAMSLNGSLDVTSMAPTHLTGTLVVDKETTLNGAVEVRNMASTHLTGTLDVDKTLNVDGAVSLNNTLDVTGMHATNLTGTLTVGKTTTLNNDLTVAQMVHTHLTGDLEVDGDVNSGTVTVANALEVGGMNPTDLSGTLTVDKLATFEAGLVVSGQGTLGPNGEHLAYFNNTEGSNQDGIAIQLDKTSINKLNNFMTFYKGDNSVAGRIEGYNINDMDDIPVPTEDEIWSAVCIGIADYNPITIFWTQTAHQFNLFSALWNNTVIPEFDIPDIPPFTITDVPALTIPDVPAFVITDVPGFTIPDIPGVVIPNLPGLTVGPLLCTEICFCPCTDLSWDCCCEDICLIPAEFEIWPEINIPDFPGIAIPDFPGISIPDFPGIPVPDFPGIAIPDFPGLVIPTVPEIDLAELWGECPTIPTFSDILIEEGICPDENIFDLNDGYIKRLAAWAFEYRLHNLVKADPLALVAGAVTWGLTTATMQNGAVYGSKGADYAEYLPKMYASEQFMKGEVVGVHNGKITKNTTQADQVLAITSQPLVLGNMQDEQNTDAFEKVAFLGQIPVFVNGPVELGDYILPSGKNDGIARAIPAHAMTADLLSQVLGTAWSAYAGTGVTLINTSIGLRPMEIADELEKQKLLEEKLEKQIQVNRSKSDDLAKEIASIKLEVYRS